MATAVSRAPTELKEDGSAILLLPYESNMKAFDGALLFKLEAKSCALFLQVTIADRHPTRENAAAFLDGVVKAVPKGTMGALVFVLPNYQYVGWQVQNIADSHVKSIVQFALCPGMEDREAKKTGKRPEESAGSEAQGSAKRQNNDVQPSSQVSQSKILV
eukprot:CAMPEP_0169445666 /NCGR_PEP_ID=MMETSP1042-20121227/10562_1 /TAXON_ID=464988 /ORGANISM="Hemiselmis andersenii, Strain CCMP1180" /LENGTH=159 /DNA_ID=CAMNT_0009557079 /DNA_START=202 /DNA_END=682 /DNA_ORIENTATION=+